MNQKSTCNVRENWVNERIISFIWKKPYNSIGIGAVKSSLALRTCIFYGKSILKRKELGTLNK